MTRWTPTMLILGLSFIVVLRKYFHLDKYLNMDKYPIGRKVAFGLLVLYVIGALLIVFTNVRPFVFGG
jgi:hypothetical protein